MSSRIRSISIDRRTSLGSSLFVGSLLAAGGVLAACSAYDAGSEPTEESVAAVTPEPPPLPSPRDFVRGLDLECYHSEGPPPVQELDIRQLNPVLKGILPNQKITLGPMVQTCLPVAKNNNIPPAAVRRFISMVDLSCYSAEAAPVDVDVNLRHLNPVLQDLPAEDVTLKRLRRFCSPVRKNDAQIDPAVLRLTRHLDFACYEFEDPTPSADRDLELSHLNPLVREMGFPNRHVHLERANQLCVPVGKNQQPIPEDVQRVVEWTDFMQYRFDVINPNPVPPIQLWLTQLNPLFNGFATPALLHDPYTLMVPVAKNNTPPPL